ncbi:MAG: ABC transporter [Gammaproteobacteria bacterium (ex Lamellibrachia satsuma)]|nr:MAG: ATP-binding cassette domain-containing protein [Gammaproteobacteria bacterium (ex Lamellibrachia satsuma)]RRS31321.1 MAG: ABC transporter [Gammaproteobacteria bacterium (ex Lamellibrachia satsuma)]RRS36937.1 MAG: ABC transporter [Gammaproteobacteria bacterium (ex Lamellibrachia satsuma)]
MSQQKHAESRPIVRAEDLSKQVSSPDGPLDILQGVNLDLQHSETLAVVGASGSGKSTLLGLLAGLDLPSRGRVELNGQNLNSLDEDGRARLRRELLGFVFQSFHLLPSLSALENVMVPLELVGRSDARILAEEWLQRVGLQPRRLHRPNQLSGGEQQRVAIARAFAASPQLLLADEPTGNLDQQTGRKVIDLLFELNREHNTTLILVTHDAALADQCSRRLELAEGRLLQASGC